MIKDGFLITYSRSYSNPGRCIPLIHQSGVDANHSAGQQNEFIELEIITEALFTCLERA